MSPTHHTVASAITTAGFFYVTQSVGGSLMCFLSGIFIDIDHHFDLWIYKKKILLHPRDLWHFCENEKNGRLHLIFHSYELFAVFWLCLFLFKPSLIWWGMAVGATVHMILDQIFNPLRPGVYFLWYRIKNKFAKEAFFYPKHYEKML